MKGSVLVALGALTVMGLAFLTGLWNSVNFVCFGFPLFALIGLIWGFVSMNDRSNDPQPALTRTFGGLTILGVFCELAAVAIQFSWGFRNVDLYPKPPLPPGMDLVFELLSVGPLVVPLAALVIYLPHMLPHMRLKRAAPDRPPYIPTPSSPTPEQPPSTE